MDGQFPVPTSGNTPLLNFGCKPRIQPYLASDEKGSFVVPTDVRYDVGVPFDVGMSSVRIHAEVLGIPYSFLPVPSALMKPMASFDLSSLSPKDTLYTASCITTAPNGIVLASVSEELWVLPPNPYGGPTTKMDCLTGALLVNRSGKYETLLGTGFYAGFSWWLSLGVETIIEEIASYGFNIIHPVGTDTNDTAMDLIFRKAEELDMWVIPGLATNAELSAQGNNSHMTARIEQWRGYIATVPTGR